jgi:hypothetical protein
MVKRKKRKWLSALSPLLLPVAVAGITGYLWARNVLEVRNSSGMAIDELTLTVCARHYTLSHLPEGETGKLTFYVTGDSNFQIRASLEDGTVLSSSFGRVTGGTGAFHNRPTITVRSNVIEGTQ